MGILWAICTSALDAKAIMPHISVPTNPRMVVAGSLAGMRKSQRLAQVS